MYMLCTCLLFCKTLARFEFADMDPFHMYRVRKSGMYRGNDPFPNLQSDGGMNFCHSLSSPPKRGLDKG